MYHVNYDPPSGCWLDREGRAACVKLRDDMLRWLALPNTAIRLEHSGGEFRLHFPLLGQYFWALDRDERAFAAEIKRIIDEYNDFRKAAEL